MDFRFFQIQKGESPTVWGDFVMSPQGDLETVSGQEELIQAATARLLTTRAPARGYRNYPNLGADLGKLLGKALTSDLLQTIERQAQMALTYDSRFPQGTTVKAIPQGKESVRLYILVPQSGQQPALLQPPIIHDLVRGAVGPEPKKVRMEDWLWRRGHAAIHRSYQLWRAWLGQKIVWRLSPSRLVTKAVSSTDLSGLGLFTEPFLIYQDGFLFCGRGPTSGHYQPRAWAKAAGWQVDPSAVAVETLPTYPGLPDGVWCDEDTNWNLVIIINSQTAGQFNESAGQWEFLDIREVGS